MRAALEELNYDVPIAMTTCLELSSPGWAGMSAGDLIEAALGGEPPDSPRARHAIVVLDELAHAGLIEGLHGNSLGKRQETLASLLALVGHGTVHLGDSAREWSSREALVIGMGAFTGRLADQTRVPSVAELAKTLPVELVTRFEETIILRPLSEPHLIALLRRWPALISVVSASVDTQNRPLLDT